MINVLDEYFEFWRRLALELGDEDLTSVSALCRDTRHGIATGRHKRLFSKINARHGWNGIDRGFCLNQFENWAFAGEE